MSRPCVLVLLGTLLAPATPSSADELKNGAFTIQYDGSGIRSLRRTNDAYDTEYIAPNGTLGRLLIRYRTTRNGDWRELRDMLRSGEQKADAVGYTMGVQNNHI